MITPPRAPSAQCPQFDVQWRENLRTWTILVYRTVWHLHFFGILLLSSCHNLAYETISRFWKRAGYVPLYIRQTTSELTGEHTCVILHRLNSATDSELDRMAKFAKRWLPHLLEPSSPMLIIFYLVDFVRQFLTLGSSYKSKWRTKTCLYRAKHYQHLLWLYFNDSNGQ